MNGSHWLGSSSANLRPQHLPQQVSCRTSRLFATAPTQKAVRDELLESIEHTRGNQGSDEGIKELVKGLTATPTPDAAAKTFELGVGTWEVFCAPHITGLSRALGTSFQPIRYTLKDGKGVIVSNVRYSSSLFKEGWLSASGTMEASGTNTLQIHFDRFWVDFGNNLRTELNRGEEQPWDRLVMALGKLGFISAFSYFPVDYVDSSLAVFRFDPLKSFIAVRRV